MWLYSTLKWSRLLPYVWERRLVNCCISSPLRAGWDLFHFLWRMHCCSTLYHIWTSSFFPLWWEGTKEPVFRGIPSHLKENPQSCSTISFKSLIWVWFTHLGSPLCHQHHSNVVYYWSCVKHHSHVKVHLTTCDTTLWHIDDKLGSAKITQSWDLQRNIVPKVVLIVFVSGTLNLQIRLSCIEFKECFFVLIISFIFLLFLRCFALRKIWSVRQKYLK